MVKRIFDLIKTLKTITTLLKVSQIFELCLLALLQGTIKKKKINAINSTSRDSLDITFKLDLCN